MLDASSLLACIIGKCSKNGFRLKMNFSYERMKSKSCSLSVKASTVCIEIGANSIFLL